MSITTLVMALEGLATEMRNSETSSIVFSEMHINILFEAAKTLHDISELNERVTSDRDRLLDSLSATSAELQKMRDTMVDNSAILYEVDRAEYALDMVRAAGLDEYAVHEVARAALRKIRELTRHYGDIPF